MDTGEDQELVDDLFETGISSYLDVNEDDALRVLNRAVTLWCEEEALHQMAHHGSAADLDQMSLLETAADNFEGFDEIVEAHSFDDAAKQGVEAAVVKQLAMQATWPTVTDNDRLNLAFKALQSGGIHAVDDLCCSNCGHDLLAKDVTESKDLRGYAFWVGQYDVAEPGEKHDLHIYFGAPIHDAEAFTGIGREVAAALRAEGLTVRWDEDPSNSIKVMFEWRLRWQPDAEPGTRIARAT